MNIPKNVIVCGISYKVVIAEDEIDAEEEYGRVSFQSRIIRIQNTGSEVVNMQTLFHEILHVLSYHYKLDLDLDEESHDKMDLLASVLVDTLIRSDILTSVPVVQE